MKEVIGDLRRSQLISTFGVGSMLDLPSLSGIQMGLDFWDVAKCLPISEPRLLRAVQGALGNLQITEIRQGPQQVEQGRVAFPIDPYGVPVSLFPRWLRCPLCSALAHLDSGLFKLQTEPYRTDKTRYIHEGCQRAGSRTPSTMPGAVPARFVVACENGHIEDFPWIDFCHRGAPCLQPRLRLYESGVSGEAADVFVRCENCSTSRPMADAFGPKSDIKAIPCGGYHAHLHARSTGCAASVRAILIGASNAYFPLSLSVLSLPITTNPIEPIIQRHWPAVSIAKTKEMLDIVRQLGKLGDLEPFTDDQIWEGVERLRNSEQQESSEVPADIKRPEWNLLCGSNGPVLTERLTTSISPTVPGSYSRQIARVVLVERFTEVRALIGFTRIESAGDMSELDSLPSQRRAPLSRRRTQWVPGVEVRGEGVFLQFKEVELAKWEARDPVKERLQMLVTAHDRWCNARPWMSKRPAPPTARFVLLHTFSHLLMREMGIRCGYGTASLRERIYCSPASDPEGAMAGVFIGTSSSDSEGTLGGLVALGQSEILNEIIQTALSRAAICSSDPICSGHDASQGQKLHSAACHSCGFVPETSCERSNSFLDRSMVIETLDQHNASFFEAL